MLSIYSPTHILNLSADRWLWYWEGLYVLPMWQREKGEVLLFRFCPVGAIWNEFDISHCMRESSATLYQPLEQWPQSVWQHPCILFPDALCLSVLVFFCKCSWHFVYLSFKHDGKIMSKNEREKKKTSILHLLNLLKENNSAPFSKH